MTDERTELHERLDEIEERLENLEGVLPTYRENNERDKAMIRKELYDLRTNFEDTILDGDHLEPEPEAEVNE